MVYADNCILDELRRSISYIAKPRPPRASLKGRVRSTPVVVVDLCCWAVPPPGERVEVGGGVKDRPEGDRVSGR
jgi:hypothetical protein